MSITVGKSVARVDAFDKVTGRTKYYEDRMPAGALYIRIKHAEIAHGFVKSVDTAAAEAIDGVVKVLTCFDVPDIPFPTAGHPWSMDPGHQDVADRHLLNRPCPLLRRRCGCGHRGERGGGHAGRPGTEGGV